MTEAEEELKKRRREWSLIIGLAVVFLALTWIAFKLFGFSKSLPVVHSIFFFGLLNFNIILFLLLAYFIFRNFVKIFSERQSGIIGGSLKSKLVAAFVGFSFVPTALMFIVSVFYINNSFDKWFSEKVAAVLKSSLEVTNAFYLSTKKQNYHFAEQIAEDLGQVSSNPEVAKRLVYWRKKFRLNAVEYYGDLLERPILIYAKEDGVPSIPPVNQEFLQKGILQKSEASTIHYFGQGNLVRVIVPVKGIQRKGAIVVSTFIHQSLIAKMDDVAATYEEFRDINPVEYPLKTIYLIILILMTLVILLGATWFGFYLAKQLSIPLEQLGEASQAVSRGEFRSVEVTTGSREINQLIGNFNVMTENLQKFQREILEVNSSLQSTLGRLNEHSKYIEVVLGNVTTGVISIDKKGFVTMVNDHAANLLNLDAEAAIGQPSNQVLAKDYVLVVEELLQGLRKHHLASIQREVRIEVNGQPKPIQLTVSLLLDDQNQEIGNVLVFDDLTMVLNAQRAVAWKEVARRIAHEIKNPLTPIKLSAERLQKKFGLQITDPAFIECTSMIIHQVDDLKTLVNEFSQFARLPQSHPTLSSLNPVIEESIGLFRQAHKDIQIDFIAEARLPAFLFDPDQMKRAITNLIDNAISAVATVSGPEIRVQTDYDENLRIARISVQDNGTGIPAGMRDRIFEPYVTTKKDGTGLGLAIVKKSVEDHNGFIRAFPVSPRGTKMVIELPVQESQGSSSMSKNSRSTV